MRLHKSLFENGLLKVAAVENISLKFFLDFAGM
jgi:hypothetical protein